MTGRPILVSTVAAVLVVSALAAPASAAPVPDWTDAADVPGTAGLVNPLAVTAADGTDAVLWLESGSAAFSNEVHAKVRLPGRSAWTDVPARLQGSFLGLADLAPTRGGDVWLAYETGTSDSRVFLSRLDTRRARWTPPVRLFTDQPDYYATQPQLATSADDTLVVAALAPLIEVTPDPVYRLVTATRTPKGRWSSSRFLTAAGGFAAGLDLSVNARGDAVISFIDGYDLADLQVRAATRARGKPWEVSPPLWSAADTQRARSAIAPDGTAAVVWSSPAVGPQSAVRTVMRPTRVPALWAGTTLVGATPVELDTWVAAGAGGEFTFFWQTAGSGLPVWSRHFGSGGFEPAVRVTASGEYAQFIDAVRRPDGRVLLVSQRADLGLESLGIEARVLTHGVAGAPEQLTGDLAAFGPTNGEQVSVDAAGRGVLLYTRGVYPDSRFGWQAQLGGPVVLTSASSGKRVRATSVTGTAAVGERVACRTGFWVETRRLAYQWTRNGVDIRTATSQRYRVAAADAGKRLACTVVARGIGATRLILPGKARRVSR